jgi:S1-C subfamily serine protease
MSVLTLLFVFLALNMKAAPVDPPVPGIDEKKIEDITKMVAPSVVKVEARNGMRKVATGVVIDRDGFIVTTALISPRDEKISIITADGKRIEAEFKGLDTQTQIALIQAKDKSLAPIAFGKSDDLRPGAWIGVVGLSPENTTAVTQGIVSSVGDERLRLNVWVVPGSSGSPVVNANGQMVGLLRGTYMEEQPLVFEFREREAVGTGYVFSKAEAPSSGMALAVPVNVVAAVAADIKKSGRVQRGWLGVSIAEKDGKVEVVDIDAKSPAELAKLDEGDFILKIDGKDITTSQALSSEIRKRKPGQDVTLHIERDGKPSDIKVKLGEFTQEDAQKELELRFPRFFAPLKPAPGVPKSQKPEKMIPAPKLPEFKKDRFFAWEKRKYIGLSLQETNKELAEFFGVKDGVGLLVAEFAEDSPAKKAGLKVGDVIIKADGRRVQSVSELSEMIQDKKKGDKIKIEFLRDKKTMTVDVEIAEEERSFGGFFENSQETARMFQDQMRKLNEEYSLQMKEYNQKSEESLRRIAEELNKKTREMTEQNKSLDRRNYYRI